jgi:peptide/nickel transport system substrate-binding protein
MIKGVESELSALDDRNFRWVLRKPFPKLLLALGKNASPCCFIMPERIAATDPFKQITEYVGSGPMRFLAKEWVPGARSVFERFDGYVPRQEPASWLAGGKRMLIDRAEWIVMPDAATASAALQSGEIDWWETPISDVVPVLRGNGKIKVDVADELGYIGMISLNHLYPPFNDVRARRALLMGVNQEDYMRAYVGDDPQMWKPMPGFFTPGTPLYNEEGGDILKGPRDLAAARKLLAESGYAGEPVTCMAAQDFASHKAFGDVTADMLRRLGINVDFVSADWGTVIARRTQKSPPGKGGWQMFHTTVAGTDCITPATYPQIRANGDAAWFGWPNIPEVETQVAAWFEAKSPEEEKAAARRLNKAALDNVVALPLGLYLQYQAWRTNVSGIVKGPLPFFWGVGKSA